MPPAGVFIVATAIGFFALGGWGWIAKRAAGASAVPLFVTVALGMAALICLGGVLNLTRLAFRPALDLLVLAGLAAAAVAGALRLRESTRWRFEWNWASAVAAVPLVAAGWLVARYLTPASAFNWHDDFERYFSYPVRMLATGTVAGNPLGYMGADTFGGQALLQAFVVRYSSIDFIGSLDTGFGLLLCLGLAAHAGSLRRSAVLVVAAQLSLIAIDPQIVNVSSLFTTSGLVMAAGYLGRFASMPERKLAPRGLLGLVYAGLVALRTTNVIFVAAHFTMLALVNAVAGRRDKAWLRPWAAIAGWTALFVLPWIATHYGLYRSALGAAVSVPSSNAAVEPLNLFSTAIPFYGTPQVYFTLVALGALGLGAWGLFALMKTWLPASPETLAGIAIAGAAAVSYFLLVAVLAPLIFGREASTRYCCPILIGAIPAAILLLGGAESRPPARHQWVAAAVFGVAVFALFLPSLQKRVRQIKSHGSPLAFIQSVDTASYAAYNREVLHGQLPGTIRAIQALVPPREPIVVWIMAPFWLDFDRNPIYNTDPYGLAMPWAKLPPARYFLWQYRGEALRSQERYRELLLASGAGDRVAAARALEFIEAMERLSRNSDILYNDGALALMRTRM